jgi:hypothetical protein
MPTAKTRKATRTDKRLLLPRRHQCRQAFHTVQTMFHVSDPDSYRTLSRQLGRYF